VCVGSRAAIKIQMWGLFVVKDAGRDSGTG